MPEVRYLREMISGVPVVTTPAEIDVTTADELRMVLLEAAAGGQTTVVVNMTHTRFCDSCGIHTLLRAHNQAMAAGGELLLVIPADGAVPRIFTLTCLDRFIACFGSLEEALAQAPAAMTLAGPGPCPGSGSPAHQPGSPDARVRADG